MGDCEIISLFDGGDSENMDKFGVPIAKHGQIGGRENQGKGDLRGRIFS